MDKTNKPETICVLMPTNFTEYIMLLFLYQYHNEYHNEKKQNNNKFLIYDNTSNNSTNIIKKYNLFNYETIAPNIINELKYKLSNIQTLYFNMILSNSTHIFQNIFTKIFITSQLVTRQFMRKRFNSRDMILLHITENSMANVIYFIIAIQSILKIELIREKDINDDEQLCVNTNNELVFVIYSDTHATNKENIIHCKQFIHQICLALPFLKEKDKIVIGNEFFEDHINNYKETPEITKLIMYNLSYYTIVSTTNNILFALSTFNCNKVTFIYPERIIDANIKRIIEKMIGVINYKTAKKNEDVSNRFINI